MVFKRGINCNIMYSHQIHIRKQRVIAVETSKGQESISTFNMIVLILSESKFFQMSGPSDTA